jgi:N-acetylmuramoyl-L-alanine amidase
MRKIIAVVCLAAAVLAGCSSPVTYVKPREWISTARLDSIVVSFRPFLEGKKIYLDPGHGGDDRVNRGPAGDVIEADVNLRVGLALRDYLTRAGAVVFLSRDHDTAIALQERPMLAVRAGADIFISLHHNATGTRDNITNYSSTYYHSRDGRTDYHPANHDIARYIQRDMSYAMRNPNPPFSPTFDGTLSDFDIYPNSGFAVLRNNPLPAVLTEGSFFTHPPEEQRLAAEEFNRIEAWGIFLGLGKYFKAGVPVICCLSDTISRTPYPAILLGVTDDCDPSTVTVTIDGAPAQTDYDDSLHQIRARPDRELASGVHSVEACVRNTNDNASWPFVTRLHCLLPPAQLSLAIHPSLIATIPGAPIRVHCPAIDSAGSSVADGIAIRMRGTAWDTVALTVGGMATAYFPVPSGEDSVVIEASAGSVTTAITVLRDRRSTIFVVGTLLSSDDSSAVAGARAEWHGRGSSVDTSWSDGRFLLTGVATDAGDVTVSRDGFFTDRKEIRAAAGILETTVRIRPIAARALFGKTYLIDPRFGGTEPGESEPLGKRSADLNLTIARRLKNLLVVAGANGVLVRISDTTITEAARARFSSGFPRGWYIRIDASGKTRGALCQIYSNIPNRTFSGKLLAGLRFAAGLDSLGIEASNDKFFNDVAMATISVVLPSAIVGPDDITMKRTVDAIAWGLFAGILSSEGMKLDTTDLFLVTDSATGQPRPGAVVELNETLTAISDESGIVRFYGLGGTDAVVRPLTEGVTVRASDLH